MAYKVEFPPDIEKKAEFSRGLSLPKNTGETGETGEETADPTDRQNTTPEAGVLQTKVIQLPRRCEHCSKSKKLKGAPRWRRHGRIVPRTYLDGRVELGCHFCGRAVKE